VLVYKATSPSGKSYIGITTGILSRRISAHKSRAKNAKKLPFYAAINKYGIDSFVWEIIFTTENHKELVEKEISLIKEYNTAIPNGYNVTAGGEGTLGFKSRLGKQLTEDQKIKHKIICRKNGKKTIIVDLQNKKIYEYGSIAEAAEKLNINYGILKIARKRNSRQFQYRIFTPEGFASCNNIFEDKNAHNEKAITLYSGSNVRNFKSMAEASRELNLTEHAIRNIVHNKKTVKGWAVINV